MVQPVLEPRACALNLAFCNSLVSSDSPTRNQHYTRQLIYMISFPCPNIHRRSIVSIFKCTRVPSRPVAPSHPQSRDKLAPLPQICVRKFVTKVDMKSRLVNCSYLWTLFLRCGFCLIYQCFWHLTVENRFPSSHISAAFFSLLSRPDMHSWFFKQTDKSKQEGYSRAPKCCAVDISLWAQCLKRKQASCAVPPRILGLAPHPCLPLLLPLEM